MQIGDLLLNISSFLSTLWVWISRLFTVQFNLGGLEISLWSIFLGLGVTVFITVFIISVFN